VSKDSGKMNATVWDLELSNVTIVVMSTFGAMCLLIVVMLIAGIAIYWFKRKRRVQWQLDNHDFTRIKDTVPQDPVHHEKDEDANSGQLFVPAPVTPVMQSSIRYAPLNQELIMPRPAEYTINSNGMAMPGMAQPMFAYPIVSNIT
jgi:hypothetical protein